MIPIEKTNNNTKLNSIDFSIARSSPIYFFLFYYSLLKLSTTIAPIDAGMVINIHLFKAMMGSSIRSNLFKASKTKVTTSVGINA
jgi:hypothetical protein